MQARHARRRRDLRLLHVAAGLHDDRERRLHVQRALVVPGREHRSRHPRHEVSRSTPGHRTRRSPAVRPGRPTSRTPSFTFTHRGRRDVRVQARHARRRRHVRRVHLAAGLHDDRQRRLHVLGARHATPRATSTRRPATRTFTVDTAAPDTTINSGPTGTTTRRLAVVHVLGDRGRRDVRVQARRPGRRRHLRRLHLAAGLHDDRRRRLHVLRARDATPPATSTRRPRRGRSRSTRPRRTRRSLGPTGTTDQHLAVVHVHEPEAGATFECKLDGPGATTGHLRGLHVAAGLRPAGRRRVHVLGARDATRPATSTRRPRRGRSRSTPTAPDTTITSGRRATTNARRRRSRSPRAKPGSTFECKLDGPGATHGTYAACTSPRAYTSLADGAYTFSVRATDSRGQRRPDARHADVHGRHHRAGHARSPAARRADQRRQRDVRRSRARGRRDVRVPARRPRRRGRHLRAVHVAADPRLAGRRRVHVLRARDRRRRQRRRDARRRARSRSTRPRRTRRSRRTDRDDERRLAVVHVHRARPGATFECKLDAPGRRGHVRGLHLAAGRTRRAGRRRLHVLGPGDRRRGQRRPDARDADVHGRHGRAGHDDHRRPDGHDERRLAVVRVHLERGRARRSSASSTARRGAGTYAACTSPQAYTALADGTYTFSVRATDAAGNVDPTPATRSFTVDTAAPDTTINARSDGHDERRVAVVHVLAPRPARRSSASSTARARRPARYAACTSPRAYSALADGAYTFSVRATDAAGNVDPTPGDADVHGRHHRAGHDDQRGPDGHDERRVAVVRVHLDEAGLDVRVQARRPGRDDRHLRGLHLAAGLQRAGRRRVHVLGPRDRRGRQRRPDARPRGRSRSTRPRRTRRSPRSDGHDERRRRRRSAFTGEAGATFECKLDGPGAATGTYAALHVAADLRPLADGSYTFSVRATDAAGNIDATPATRTFTVDTAAPDTTITSGPTGTTTRLAVVRVHGERGRARRSSASSTARARRPARTRPAPRREPYGRARGRRRTRSRSARPDAGGQRRRDARPRGRSRSTPTAPDTTITSGPTGRRTRRRRRSRSRASRARRSSASSTARARRRHVRGVHVAAGLQRAGRRRRTRSRCARPTPPATSTRRPRRGRSRSTRPRRTRRSPAARAARRRRRRRRSRSPREAGRDVRVQARRPRRDAGTYAACTSPKAYSDARRRHLHVLGARQGRGRQRRRHARRRARSRSRPSRRPTPTARR